MFRWFDLWYCEEEDDEEAELYEQFRALMIDDPQQSSEKLITPCSIPDDEKFDFAKLSGDLQLDVLDHLDAKTRLKLLQVDKTLRQNVLDWGPFGKRIPRIFFSCAFPDEANKDPYFEIDNLEIEHDWSSVDNNMIAARRLLSKIRTAKLLDLTLGENVKEDPRFRFLKHLLPALCAVQELVVCNFDFGNLLGFMRLLERLRVDHCLRLNFDDEYMDQKALEHIITANGASVIQMYLFTDCPNINLYTVLKKANTNAQFIEIAGQAATFMCSQLLDSLLLHGVPSLFEDVCIWFEIHEDIDGLLGKFVCCDKMYLVNEDEEIELVVATMNELNLGNRKHNRRTMRRMICYRQSVTESSERYFLIVEGLDYYEIFCKEIRWDK